MGEVNFRPPRELLAIEKADPLWDTLEALSGRSAFPLPDSRLALGPG
jgi:hypothetical protein